MALLETAESEEKLNVVLRKEYEALGINNNINIGIKIGVTSIIINDFLSLIIPRNSFFIVISIRLFIFNTSN